MTEEDSQPPPQLSPAEIKAAKEAAKEATKILPSITDAKILQGKTYSYHSPIPHSMQVDKGEVILGVDEAGRGPVLGPMVYAVAYCLKNDSAMLEEHKFDDSKKLTRALRTHLMETLCDSTSALHAKLGWSTISLSPRDISAGMLRSSSSGNYNLNAQALDVTTTLISTVLATGVNVTEIYVDTVGTPSVYQAKLAKLFPTANVTVSKKADSIYPIVSAASVCAKVTRDAAIEVLVPEGEEIGSGYPGDEKTKGWLRREMEPVFGWEVGMARFSWATAKDMLEGGGGKGGGKGGIGVAVEWPDEDGEGGQTITGLWGGGGGRGVAGWYGRSVHNDF